jgi:hypothetical protein
MTDRLQKRCLIVGAAAFVLCALGMALNSAEFYRGYLLGYLYWLAIALGSLAILMLQHLAGGVWGYLIQRILEAAARTLPLMALLFVPLLFGLRQLYSWARPDAAADHILHQKAIYLNIPFFLARAALYFAVWIILTLLLSKWSAERDRTGNPALTLRIRRLSAPGIALYVLTMTFAAIDWGMSLEPHWFSTIYGLVFVVGQTLATWAFVILAASWLAQREPLAGFARPGHFHDLGHFMLAFTVLWAYMSFSQFLIIWSANLPEEIPWYVHRAGGSWQAVAGLLLLFHFFVPFLLLLSRRAKRTMETLWKIAAAMLFMRFVDLFWLLIPAFHEEGVYVHWLYLAAPAAIGGIWIAAFLRQLKARPLLALHDPRLEGVTEHA